MDTVFQVRNNSARCIGLDARLCIAGAGCATPTSLKDTAFRLPGAFEMSEEGMFKSWRGVLAHMNTPVMGGNKPEIEVFANGVSTPLTDANIREWVSEYRSKKGLPEPKTPQEHNKELIIAMNRPEDWIERQAREEKAENRKAQEERDAKMIETVTASVLKALAERERLAAVPAAPAARAESRK